MLRRFILLAVAALVAGCATAPRDPSAARQRAYERLLTFIEPGMTRRQLYALLPPARTPEAFPSPIFAVAGIYNETFQIETYPLDKDFSLRVPFPPGHPLIPQRKLPQSTKPQPPFGASRPLSASAIDKLLFAPEKPRSYPSAQDPNDVIAARPTVFRHDKNGR